MPYSDTGPSTGEKKVFRGELVQQTGSEDTNVNQVQQKSSRYGGKKNGKHKRGVYKTDPFRHSKMEFCKESNV